jgi:hypothetical protein
MKNSIRGFYSGCVKSGNLGDDILFIIFLNIFSKVITSKYKKECKIIKKNLDWGKYDNWIGFCRIGVIGGGSVIHPEEISYTNGVRINNNIVKNRFAFGTGITDTPKFRIPEKNRIDLIEGRTNNVDFPVNPLMKYNIEGVNLCNYGGLRGPLDVNIARSINPKFNKEYIYDPGLIISGLVDIKKINSNVIGINLAEVSGDNRISKKSETHSDYNKRVYSVIYNFCCWAIQNKYDLHFYSFGNGDSHIHQNIIERIRKKKKKGKIDFTCLNTSNLEEISKVLSTFKFCVSHRLHSNILVNSFFIPTICMGYNIKALNYMKSIECEDLFIPTNENFTLDNIIKKVNLLENNFILYEKKLEEHVQKSLGLYTTEFLKIVDSFGINQIEHIEINYDILSNIYGIYEINIYNK